MEQRACTLHIVSYTLDFFLQEPFISEDISSEHFAHWIRMETAHNQNMHLTLCKVQQSRVKVCRVSKCFLIKAASFV